MQQIRIPDNVLEFLARRIDSVPHLEVLLLCRDNPEIDWSEDVVSRRVYVSPERARQILHDLCRNGFLTPSTQTPDTYRYETAWDAAQLMPEVAATYRRHLVHVTGLIHAKAASGAVQDFARAFRFKSKE